MKIVCDACGTRYSIEDSRVAGRSFKIRCKQCAHVILLQGTRAPTAEPAAAGTWHAVVDGLPRPIGAEDLRQLRTAGVLEDRTPVYGVLPFAEPAVLIPSSPPRRDRRLIWALTATASALVAVTVILAVIVLRGGTAAHAGTPPALPPTPGASPPAATAPGGVLAALATPGAVAHTEPTAADPARTSAEASAPSADRIERAAADLSAHRTEHTAASSSADQTEPVAATLSANRDEHAAPTSAIRTDQAASSTSADRADHAGSSTSVGRTDRAVGSPSARRMGHTATAPPADQTERAAPAPSADRTDRAAASPAQTGHAAASTTHAGSVATHGPGTTTAPHGPAADAASRRASPRTSSPPADGADACSEITCIVNASDPCCAMVRRSAVDAAPAATRTDLPDHLEREVIAGVLKQIDTAGCGKQSSAHGDVKLSIKVSSSGAVAGVTVKSSPDPVLDACVTAAVQKATFGATQHGGSFAYIWRF